MGLSMKDRYAGLDLSKLPVSYKAEFEEMNAGTAGFSNEELNDVYIENFNEMYALVEQKYPGAISKGGTLKKVKPAKVKVIKPKQPVRLPEISYKGKEWFVDFKLEQIRDMHSAEFIDFIDLPSAVKAKLRGVRAEKWQNVYIASLDDDTLEKKTYPRKKLSAKDISDIEGFIASENAKELGDSMTNAAMITALIADFHLSGAQAEKWVASRGKYGAEHAYGDYVWRTEAKKAKRRSSDKNIVKTRDGYEFNRKDPKMKGEKFFDENGKQWTCKGYSKELDECIMEDSDGKEISSCIKDMYVYNPVQKREKGNLVDECKETLKEAGYSVKVHQAGTKKLKRSEPRPEKEIIKERVEGTFKPILKDISGSEENREKYKSTISALDRVQALFTKLFNRLSNLAEDNKADAIEKIEKLLKEIVD